MLLALICVPNAAVAQGTSKVTIEATQDDANIIKISTNGGAASNVRLPGSGLVRGQDYFVSGEGTSVVTITFDNTIVKGDTYEFKCDTATSGSHCATVQDSPAGWSGS